MSLARPAVPADAAELVRLRKVMLDSYRGPDPDIGWQPGAERTLRERLAGPGGDLMACVVDRPGPPGGLAACAVGTIEYRLGGPRNPTGTSGHVFASREGEPLYASLGFVRTPDPSMRLTLSLTS
ncbi:GNAT family N-acetyltransferase [Streptomyces scopuliridis]